jgi:transcriptional regulator with XRE-family HTH domain
MEPHRVIARRIKEVRTRRGWSAHRLAEEMRALGVSWDRSIVANFESGRRKYVTVEELLALAYALSVAPVYLLLPIDDEYVDIAVTPEVTAKTVPVREWIRGRFPLMGQDPRLFWSERPRVEYVYPPLPVTPLSELREVEPDGERQ